MAKILANRALSGARRALERRFGRLREADLERPSGGWIHAIRQALGMSLQQLGDRLSISAQAAGLLEASERNRTIGLDSLARAAEAMDCKLVYAIIPNRPLDDMVLERVHSAANELLEHVHRTMQLEDQAVDVEERAAQSHAALLDVDNGRVWDLRPGVDKVVPRKLRLLPPPKRK